MSKRIKYERRSSDFDFSTSDQHRTSFSAIYNGQHQGLACGISSHDEDDTTIAIDQTRPAAC
jgi:hypothetical protein